jgi:peroxiredoxin
MEAWGKSCNALGKITMVGDSRGEFTKSIGAEIDLKFIKGWEFVQKGTQC